MISYHKLRSDTTDSDAIVSAETASPPVGTSAGLGASPATTRTLSTMHDVEETTNAKSKHPACRVFITIVSPLR